MDVSCNMYIFRETEFGFSDGLGQQPLLSIFSFFSRLRNVTAPSTLNAGKCRNPILVTPKAERLDGLDARSNVPHAYHHQNDRIWRRRTMSSFVAPSDP